MSTPTVLVTPRSMTSPGAAPLLDPIRQHGYQVRLAAPGRQPTADELTAALPGCVGWIAGVEPITSDVLSTADALRVISRNGSGADSIDRDAAAARGVAVRTAPGANARAVAELTVCVLLCALRDVLNGAGALRAGGWARSTGREARGRVIGIVGYGAIGREVAALTAGLGMQRLVTDPFVSAYELPLDVEQRHLDDLLGAADVVTLHAPLPPDGPLLDRRRIELIGPDAVLVNTARAGLVDTDAVLDALEGGGLSAYAVDAFDREPPPRDALLAHPRVIATPHIGAATEESARRAASAAVANLLDALVEAPDTDVTAAGPDRRSRA